MDCKYLEKISLLIDDKLSAPEVAEASAHLATCAECQRAEKSFPALRGQLKSIKPLRDENFERKVLNDILRAGKTEPQKKRGLFSSPSFRPAIAAAMLLLVIGTLGIFLYTRSNSTNSQQSWDVATIEGAPKIGSGSISKSGRLRVGEWLETNDSSRARVAVADIGQVEVDPQTKIRLVATRADEHRLELTRGSITAQINAPPRLFFVNTPSATVIDYGCAYTLSVEDDGITTLHVTEGWVSLALGGRESLVPASAYAKSKIGAGPGTPFFEEASGVFIDALTRFDFENGGSAAIDVVLAESRQRDALSLWYLLERANESDRARIFDRLTTFVPLPQNATREGVLTLNREMLDVWKETIDVVTVGNSFNLQNQNAANSNRLVSIGNMTAPRAGHTATRLADGRVLIVGGMQKAATAASSAEIFDPTDKTFSPTGSMSDPRFGHTATLLPNGEVLIAGGTDANGSSLASAEIYNPATGVFARTENLNFARSNHQATSLSDGKVLITGGSGGAGKSALSSAEIYDAEKGVFQSIGEMIVPRVFHTATRLADGSVLIAGGNTGNFSPEATLASAEIFNPSDRTFAEIGSMIEKRYSHAATLLKDGRVLITGGSTGNEWKGRTRSAEIYDTQRKVFVKSAEMSLPRFNHQAATLLLPDSRVIIAGAGARVEIYDPAQNAFISTAGNVGTGRIFSTATVLTDDSVLIAGGYNLGYPPTTAAWVYR